jgi:hypothetical protein
MSDVVNSKEKKTVSVSSLNVNIEIDGLMFESLTVESTSANGAFEKLIRWYLIFRSAYFEGLIYEDIENLITNYQTLEFDAQKEPLLLGRYEVEVPLKKDDEVVATKILKASFYKRFII